MNFVNLTPHVIELSLMGGRVAIPASGMVARLDVSWDALPEVIYDGLRIPVLIPRYGELRGLPEPQPDTLYLVSSLALAHCGGRRDVLAPDTGATAIRGVDGRIMATTRLLAAPYAEEVQNGQAEAVHRTA